MRLALNVGCALSKVCARPEAWIRDSAGGDASAIVSTARQAIPKEKPRKSSDWLKAVRTIECCVLCGKYGTQAAHRNESKGLSRKTDDALTAAICLDCHHEIDNGKNLTKEQRRATIDRAIVLTLQQLFRKQLIECKE
jgi:hypothetical protein